jgi:hypothetical protein
MVEVSVALLRGASRPCTRRERIDVSNTVEVKGVHMKDARKPQLEKLISAFDMVVVRDVRSMVVGKAQSVKECA